MNAELFAFRALLKKKGEEITITSIDGNTTVNVLAIIDGAQLAQPQASGGGGYYDEQTLTAEVLTDDLGDFVPAPMMNATARGADLRIAEDGLTHDHLCWRMTLVARNAPKR